MKYNIEKGKSFGRSFEKLLHWPLDSYLSEQFVYNRIYYLNNMMQIDLRVSLQQPLNDKIESLYEI
jgi:hypothetical protein